jgi:hypothetical protein
VPRDHAVDERGDVALARDIGGDGLGAPARRGDRVGGALRARGIQVGDDNDRAAPRERLAQRAPDARRAAGDDGNGAGEATAW